MKTLENKVILITGGSGGIGKATAKLFLAEGAKVMLVDRGEDKLKATAKELNSENLAYCNADVSKAENVQNYTKATLSKFGGIDVFFNNAGIEGYKIPTKEGEGINVVTGDMVNMIKSGIIDPLLVTKSALRNAASVATTILSTDCVINNLRN